MNALKLLVFIIVLFLLHLQIIAQTIINEGPVSGTWTLNNSPFLIQGNIEIPDDSTLIIDPGVTIEFQGHYGLNVQGVLLADGTETETILFTVTDTTGFNDINSTLGGWNGINIVDPDTTNDSTKISYCKFEYAKAVGPVWHINSGGALKILNFDKVHIANSLFQFNSAGGDTNHVPSGGAIHLAWSDIKITNNTFKNNRALTGGAIQFPESNPIFSKNVFKSNYAKNVSGAIDAGPKSAPIFSGDSLINNSSSYNGGGITFWDSTIATLENVVIENNFSRDGGGIYSTSAQISLSNCSVNNNGADWNGGGIHSFRSKLNFQRCTFRNDTAKTFGGGAGFYECEVSIDDCNFTDNSAGILGGGFHSDFSNISLSNTDFLRDTSESGGAIFVWFNELTVDNCTFNNNSAKVNSGGIHAESGTIEINNSSFSNNQSVWGGGIGLYNINSKISNSVLTQNRSEHGGGINAGMSHLDFINVSFTENESLWGGGISMGNCDVTIDSCQFIGNNAETSEGAIEYSIDTLIFNEPYNFRLLKSTIENNYAFARGAITIQQRKLEDSNVMVEIDKCNFINNTSDRVNILISGYIKDFKFSNSIISGNSSELRTSGCNFSNNVSGNIENCLFSYNKTAGGSSAVSVGVNSNISFINCTFSKNRGDIGAAFTMRNSGNIMLLNSIVWENEPYNFALSAVTDSTPCNLLLYSSDIEYGIDSILVNDSVSVVHWGTGNIVEDPMFIDSLNNFHLQNISACIGAGVKSIYLAKDWVFAPDVDLEGNPRPFPEDSNPDLGAFENLYGTPTDIVVKENIIPIAFELKQNYPNPFNPSTIIKYSIPKQGNVTLKIFDVLGGEVATLVNKQQRQGNYEVEFDGAGLTSGIYFYRLRAGEYIQLKKMLLIK